MRIGGLDEKLAALLERPLVGVLGTLTPSGSPHLTAVWYAVRGSEIVVSTAASSQKAANVRAHPVAELCVNAGPVGPCVTARGEARITGPASVELVGELARRYLGEVEGARYMQIRDPHATSVVISIKPTSWRVWDVDSAMAGS